MTKETGEKETMESMDAAGPPRHPELDSGTRSAATWDCYEREDGVNRVQHDDIYGISCLMMG